MRLHRGGRFRSWLGARFGGDAELGNRIWRRILHGLGALVLVYYLLPPNVLFGVPNPVIPLIALAAVFVLEGFRLGGYVEIPVTRPYEAHRLASYAYFGIAMVIAVLLFPEPIAAGVILGTALVDPLAGELRLSQHYRRLYPAVPYATYVGLATLALIGIGHYPGASALGLALLAAALAVAAEWPQWGVVDDDLAMTLVPGVALDVLVYLVPALA
jgi:hypothetical protein